MGVLRDILDLLVIREESRKRQLEIQRLENELTIKPPSLTAATIDDVKKYDPKTQQIIRSVGLWSLVVMTGATMVTLALDPLEIWSRGEGILGPVLGLDEDLTRFFTWAVRIVTGVTVLILFIGASRVIPLLTGPAQFGNHRRIRADRARLVFVAALLLGLATLNPAEVWIDRGGTSTGVKIVRIDGHIYLIPQGWELDRRASQQLTWARRIAGGLTFLGFVFLLYRLPFAQASSPNENHTAAEDSSDASEWV